jgi:hypothetical protein
LAEYPVPLLVVEEVAVEEVVAGAAGSLDKKR